MNSLGKIRDAVDALLNPLTRILVQNKKFIRAATIAAVIFSLALLFSPGFQKDLGSLSWALLLAILFLSPAAKISQSKTLASLMLFRRDAGILMGVFALEHALLYFSKFDVKFNSILNSSFWFQGGNLTYIGWGSLALAITLPLLATSNDMSMRILKANWKRLQRFAYLILILVALHIVFIKYNYLKAFFMAAVYIFVKLLATAGFQLPATSPATEPKP